MEESELLSPLRCHTRETKRQSDHSLSGQHLEVTALYVVVDRGHSPRDANAQEDVDGVGSCDVADRGVSVGILLGRHFGGERICSGIQRCLRFFSMPLREGGGVKKSVTICE